MRRPRPAADNARVDPGPAHNLGRGGPSSGPASLVGQRVGAYRIQALLAQGGMGAVYEAFHDKLQRQVALKTLLAGAAATKEEVQRFVAEARAVARLSHPNVVSVYDVGEAGGVLFLAMELVRGQTLHERLRAGGMLDPGDALRVVRAAAEGLHHAHEQGILHRDLKPANILLQASDGRPRLTDFGVAKAAGNARMTATGIALGTPNYMSPEQAMGLNGQLDVRTDVYGLGAILYECLTGLPPFAEASELQTMQAVVNEPLVPPRARRPELDADVDAICAVCLAKRREDRYPSVPALIADIDRWLAGEPIEARPRAATSVLARGVRRNVVLLGTSALLALALGAALLAALLPTLRRRELAALERGAAALRDERLAAARALLADAAPPRARLEGLADALAFPTLEAEARRALAPAGAEAEAAVRRGLGERAAHEREAAPLLADAALRLADVGDEAPSPAALPHLARAALLAPEAEPGRAARLALARALAARRGAFARRLAREELEALAAGSDSTAVAALGALALLRAEDGRWGVAAELAGRALAAGHADRERLALIGAIGPTWAPARDVPPGPLTRARAADGPLLVRAEGRELIAARPGATGALEEVGRWRAPGAVRQLVATDRDGDGVDELVFAHAILGGGAQLAWLGLSDPEGHAQRLAPATKARVVDLACGDVDGDGRGDVLMLLWEQGHASFVVMGGPPGEPLRLVVLSRKASGSGPPVYATGCLVDLDGDGRDEVILGPSKHHPRGALEVRAIDLGGGGEGGKRGELALGPVTSLAPVPGDGQEPARVLAVVDRAGEGARGAETPAAGLFVVGADPSGAPQVVASWPLEAAAEGPPRDVLGWTLDVGGERWLARAASWPPGGDWRLELAPLAALGDGRPRLSLLGVAPPGPTRARTWDLDGDGEPELVLGRRVLGWGADGRPARRSPAPPPAQGRAARLLRTARALVALDQRQLAEEAAIAPLEAELPESWAAQVARLAAVDALLSVGEEREAAAERAFAHGEDAAGRERLSAAHAALVEAAERAEALAGDPDRWPEQRAEASARAAHAWERAEEPARAAATLERTLARGGLPPHLAQRLREEHARLAQLAQLATLELDLAREDVVRALAVEGPLRTQLLPGGVRLRCEPDVLDAALLPLELGPRAGGPLELEAHLQVAGPAWETRVRVGLFAAAGEAGEPSAVTGFELALWDAEERLVIQPVLEGAPLGRAYEVSGFAHTLRLRLALRPRAHGVEASFEVRERGGELRFAARHLAQGASLPSAPARLVGVVSPVSPDTTPACTEQTRWPMRTSVTLERLRVLATAPRLGDDPPPLPAAHGCLARGELSAAIAAYDAVLAAAQDAPTRARALLLRAHARARSGDPEAHLDLIEAARLDPYAALLHVEDHADLAASGEHPEDLALLGAALHALAADADPLLAVLGRQLLGDVEASLDPPPAAGDPRRELAATYLAMRRVRARDRWSPLDAFRLAHPTGRLPRAHFPQVLPWSEEPLDEAAYTSLLAVGGDVWQRYRALRRAQLARPAEALPRLQLARLFASAGTLGLAETELREALARATDNATKLTALHQLAQLYARFHDKEALLDTLETALAAGAKLNDQLSPELEALLGDDPRWHALRARARGE